MKITKTEAYLNKIYGKENPESLKDFCRKVCLEIIGTYIRMAKKGDMPKEKAMESIKELEKLFKKN